jgi:hypothetical protein
MLPDSLSLTLMFLLPSSLAGAGIVKYIPSPADDVIGALCLLGLFDLILFQTFQKIKTCSVIPCLWSVSRKEGSTQLVR